MKSRYLGKIIFLKKKHVIIDIDSRFESILKKSTMVSGIKIVVVILGSYKKEVSTSPMKETTSRLKRRIKSDYKEKKKHPMKSDLPRRNK